jgi:hypothetical protein
MELLPGFRMRPPHDVDADAVAALSNEESVAFIGFPSLTPTGSGRAGRLRESIATATSRSSSRRGALLFLSVEAEPAVRGWA